MKLRTKVEQHSYSTSKYKKNGSYLELTIRMHTFKIFIQNDLIFNRKVINRNFIQQYQAFTEEVTLTILSF